jgi:putative (di)nucleoside polyphosphate hydrolase
MPQARSDLKVSRSGPPAGYRPCVGLMLINRARRLFIGEREGPALNLWQMPQGGIDRGEAPRDAARRELREEVGTDLAELVAESRAWYAYDLPPEMLPPHWGGRYRGQSQRWFAFRFTGTDRDIDIAAHDDPEFTRWRWASPDEVLALIVAFKRPVYRAVLAEFARLLRG